MTREQKNTMAIHLLDLFTKTWCVKTDNGLDLAFECSDCEFQEKSGHCMVKRFAHNKEILANYPMENFGSMIR